MEERSSEGERQSGDEQLAGDAEQKQAGPTGPGAHKLDNEELLRDSWGSNRCSELTKVSSPCQVWWGSDFTRRRGGQKS